MGSLASAFLLLVLALSTGRGHRGIERLVELMRGEPETQTVTVVEEVPVETRVEVPVEVPVPAPPERVDPRKTSVREMTNGIQLQARVKSEPGTAASRERQDEESYVVDLSVRVREPAAVSTVAGLSAVQPGIDRMLPGLGEMVDQAVISPYFHRLYDNKAERLKTYMLRLGRLLSRHNFFDCETILELTHPVSGRRVLLLQAEMDVVSDGSDGDRLPEMPEKIVNSSYYQPSTSYRWKKRTKTPNPLLVTWEKRLRKAKEEYAIRGLTAERNRELREMIRHATARVAELKSTSFLIAEYDPFIVLPVFMITDRSGYAFAPGVGDYAVVLHEGKAYPAIVGDAGPNFKVGEASLRVGKEIDPRTNPYRRPVSDLKVSYLVFPATAEEEKGPPDYQKWRARCGELLGEIGGLDEGVLLHDWKDVLAEMAEERRRKEEEARRQAEEARRKAEEAAALREVEAPEPGGG